MLDALGIGTFGVTACMAITCVFSVGFVVVGGGRVVRGVVCFGVVIGGGLVVVDVVGIGGCVGSLVGVALLVGFGVASFPESTPSSSLNASSLVLIVLSGGRTM